MSVSKRPLLVERLSWLCVNVVEQPRDGAVKDAHACHVIRGEVMRHQGLMIRLLLFYVRQTFSAVEAAPVVAAHPATFFDNIVNNPFVRIH